MESMSSNDSCSLVGWVDRSSMTPAASSLPPPQGVERCQIVAGSRVYG